MMEFLDKLKRKPKHTRQRIALLTSASISLLIFVMWWTTFTATESDSSQTSLSEALSPVSALAGMANNAVDGANSFSQNLKEKVTAMQYDASSTDAQTAATATADIDGYAPSTQEVVYPEQIFGKDSPPQATETNSATGVGEVATSGTD
jgi:cytoskeletal protein RodZ